MRTALKAAVVVVPLAILLLILRMCSGGAAGRWQARIEPFDPQAGVVIDTDDLIVIAPDRQHGEAVGRTVLRFRDALIENYGDLLGRGRERRTVVVVFSTLPQLQAYAGKDDPLGAPTGRNQNLHGFTRPGQNVVFFPMESALDTLRHETVHLLMEETVRQSTVFSPWLGEGLAQLFERYDPDADPPEPPQPDAHFAQALPGGDLDVERLIAIEDYGEFTGVLGTRNYVEAALLAGFLFSERPREELIEYVDRERKYRSGRVTEFERIYAYRSESFRTDLRDYLAKLRRR